MTDQEQRNVFSTNLNALLLRNDKTQLEVSEAINVSPQTFNTWCKGKALPRMGKVQKLADYFGVNKSELIDPQNIQPADNEESALLELLSRMTDQEKQELIDYMKYLISKRPVQ